MLLLLYICKQVFRMSKERISQGMEGVIVRNLRDSGFYVKTNVLQKIHICISVPLSRALHESQRHNFLFDLKSIYCVIFFNM